MTTLSDTELAMLRAVALRMTDGQRWGAFVKRHGVLTDAQRAALHSLRASGLVTWDYWLTVAGEALIAPDGHVPAEQEPLL